MIALALLIACVQAPVTRATTFLERFYAQQGIASSNPQALRGALWKQKVTTWNDGAAQVQDIRIFFLDRQTNIAAVADRKGTVTAFLTRGTDSWLFRRGLRTPLRISQNWRVSGSVSLFDILRLPLDDYTEQASRDSSDTLLVDFLARSKGVPYPKLELVFTLPHGDLLRIRCLGAAGQRIKTAELGNYKVVSGGLRFPRWRLHNDLLNRGDSAWIEVESVRNVALPATYFRPDARSLELFLERWGTP